MRAESSSSSWGLRHPGRWIAAAAVVLVILVAGRLALNPLVAARTRQALQDLHGYRGTFADVALNLHRLAYSLTDLRIAKPTPAGERNPLVYVRHLDVRLRWRELLHGRVVAEAELDRPKLILISAKRGSQFAVPQIAQRLSRMAPLKLDRAEVRDGELLFIDAVDEGNPRLWIHQIEATLENVATRPALERGEPTTLAASGTLQRTGKLSLFLTADPLAKQLTFAGQAQLRGLQLEDLGSFLVVKGGVSPRKGILDLSTRFIAKDGRLTGGVKPLLKDAEVGPASAGIVDRLKAAVADVSLDLFSDRVRGRKAVATTIPIKGTVLHAQAQLWPTVIGVLRNSFVEGLSDSLANLPPPTAPKRENPVEQARKGLTKQHGPPAAQPSGRR